jgi:hypothetical protein
MKYNKKILIWEGPNPSSISELIDNETKYPNVSLIAIQSSIRIQIEDCRFENGENTMLRRTDIKT